MKKLLAAWLVLALCSMAALAESPRFEVPEVPEIEVPEAPEIDVPDVPKPKQTKTPRIEVPEIPEVEAPEVEAAEPSAAGGRYDVGAVLDALGDDGYRAAWQALEDGEVIGQGSKGEVARAVQRMLLGFGQDIAVDGSVGPRTIGALNAVQAEYGLEQTDALDAEGLRRLLPRLLAVTDPEAAEALLSGPMGGEYDHIRGCALAREGRWYSARQAFEASRWGDWEARAEACVQPWPKTGRLYKNPEVAGSETKLVVRFNGDGDSAILVKVYTEAGVLARTLFIRGTGEASTSLPAGTYVVKDGQGTAWYGEAETFGGEGVYEVMTFEDGRQSVALERHHTSTITVNVLESDPEAQSVEGEHEDWGDF